MELVQKVDRATLTDLHKASRPPPKKFDNGAEIPSVDENKNVGERKKPETKKLKKKLIDVSEKNQTLAKTINEKNMEIADLKRSVDSLNEVINSVPIDELRCNSSIASSKILELSKRNRQLRAELETTKNRVSKKDIAIQKLERELKNALEKSYDTIDNAAAKKSNTVDEMQSKLSSLQQKLFETRNKNIELQNQLKQAQKCLQQEVGESFNMSILAAHTSQQSNWRGRAQQIIHLQQKINELKERISLAENSSMYVNGYGNSEINMSPSKPNRKSFKKSNSTDIKFESPNTFDRFTPGVRKSEILHRAKVETLEKEIAKLKGQVDEQQKKILALKVRNKTLNDDVLKYKVKACALEEQTDYNGINITSIIETTNLQKYKYEEHLKQLSSELSLEIQQRQAVEDREQTLLGKLENYADAVADKDELIAELNAVIDQLKCDMKGLCGGFMFQCRDFRKEEFLSILDTLEAEKNKLLEYNTTLKGRVEAERNKCENLNEVVNKQKMRITRLESKQRELEKELEQQNERKKRSQRVAEYANSVSTTSINSAFGSFVFENSSHNLAKRDDELTPEQVAQLKHNLEFATEKIVLLEEKVSHLIDEKEEDCRAFNEIIKNSREIILDRIKEQRELCNDYSQSNLSLN